MDTEERCQTEVRPMPILAIAENVCKEITIRKVLNGFVVTCGCKQLVFEQQDHMLLEINRYLNNPQAVEKEYLEKFGRS